MEILEKAKEHRVTDYDFLFTSGDRVTFTIDHDAGDAAEDRGSELVFFFPAKQDPVTKEWTTNESRTIYKGQLVMKIEIDRKQKQPSESEFLELKALYHKLSKTVQ